MPAPNLRDDAEGARMVAALGDFDVGKMSRGEPEARRVVVRDVGRAARDQGHRRGGVRALLRKKPLDDRRNLCDLVEADKRVHLGHRGR